jgi:hypothetical protein
MKRSYDVLHAVLLVSFLVIANFIGNTIFKGVLLLLFSSVLIVNTALKLKIKLKMKLDSKIGEKIFYGILLFLDVVLFIQSIYVIVMTVIEA